MANGMPAMAQNLLGRRSSGPGTGATAARAWLGLASFGLASWAGVCAVWVRPAQAEPVTGSGTGQSYGNPQLQRELDYGTGKNDGGSLFNSANPIDLMNKLRKSSSMDDATSPQDAVDAALKGLAAPPAAKPSGASASVKAP